MTMYRYSVVKRTATKSLPCKGCGKVAKITFTGEATYNPYNDGDPPTQAQESADRQAAKATDYTCTWCADTAMRDCLITFADTGVVTDDWLIHRQVERGNIAISHSTTTCECCKQPIYSTSYETTAKGQRIVEKAKAKIASLKGDSQ